MADAGEATAAGSTGAAAEAAQADPATAPADGLRRRRRWRRALATLVVLVLVGGCGVVGAERYAHSRIDTIVHAALPGLSSDATITTEGFLLPQVLHHELRQLDIRADSLTLDTSDADGSTAPTASADSPGTQETDADDTGENADTGKSGLAAVESLELTGLTATLSDVGTRDPYLTGRVDASAAIAWDELESVVVAAVPEAPDLTITPQTYGSTVEPGTVKASTTLLGLDASLVFAPAVTDAGGLELSIVTVSVEGMEVDVDPDDADSFGVASALSYFGLETPTIEVDPEVLPDGLTLSQAYIARDGLRLTLSGTDVALAGW
ncbi:LmeA family phospholipid-binding protein [Actinomyces sp. MRS3W]|uniref:LmeA family phospholipid-binding protein n=1 Tax=Actinomyces sp. MRS3W TaxID=2800796 RepID=UPI0028FDA33E|nr:LmeA family phospholipid-binding protein [Actinomyces sp. MRS3W]MDU0347580.1 hypothetical protein [Actinomyces sp. MRS3W]